MSPSHRSDPEPRLSARRRTRCLHRRVALRRAATLIGIALVALAVVSAELRAERNEPAGPPGRQGRRPMPSDGAHETFGGVGGRAGAEPWEGDARLDRIGGQPLLPVSADTPPRPIAHVVVLMRQAFETR